MQRAKHLPLLLSLLIAMPAAAQTPLAVQSQSLPALAPVGDGLTTPAELGLSDQLWQNLNFKIWQALLTAQPPRQSSPLLRHLVSSAIAARAELPESPLENVNFALLRAQALSGYASADTLGLFVAAQSDRTRTPQLRDLLRDITFTANAERGCAQLAPNDSSGWKVYCDLAAGRDSEVQLQIDLMREQPNLSVQQRELIGTVDAVQSTNTKKLPEKATLLEMRLLGLNDSIALNTAASDALAARARHHILMERMLQNGAPAGLDSAEWLARYGYIDSKQLEAAYNSVKFSPEELRTPATTANKLKSATLRAYLWQVIQPISATEARARLTSDFIVSGGAPAILGNRGAMISTALVQIPSSARYAWAAPQMFALAAAQDEREAADSWYDTVDSISETLPQAKEWKVKLWPVAIAMGLDSADPAALPQWIEQTSSVPGGLPLFDILTILEARGLVVPSDIWEKASSGVGSVASASTDTVQLDALRNAAKSGRQGEVILRSGILAGTDLSQAPVPVVAAIIRAFAALGLNEMADQLATETLLTLLFPSHG